MRKLFLLLLPVFFLSSAHALELYKDNAVVSYYAEKFHGRKTANGERFNMYDYTCAHKTLPFNTILRIENPANGKRVDVRVNDRGPFVAGREADLSKAAAIKLDMIKTGTAKVRIYIVQKGPETRQNAISVRKAQRIPLTQSKAAAASTSAVQKVSYKSGQLYDIQLGAFSDEKNARTYAQKVANKKIKNVALQKSGTKVRVSVIKVDGKNVPSVIEQLDSSGFKNHLVKERK